jgi:hypothetical protein
MEAQQTFGELQRILEEIKRHDKLRLLRKILKFLLVGFLIGRDSDRRIAELTQESKMILDTLLKPFEKVAGAELQIRELADAHTRLTHIESKSADAKSILPNLKERFGKYHETMIAQTKTAEGLKRTKSLGLLQEHTQNFLDAGEGSSLARAALKTLG